MVQCELEAREVWVTLGAVSTAAAPASTDVWGTTPNLTHAHPHLLQEAPRREHA